jgi:Zn-dependent oligopeptidase
MKKLTRFYEEDLRAMVMEKYDLRPSQVTSVFTEEVVGQGMNEHTEPVFYIEVEEDG